MKQTLYTIAVIALVALTIFTGCMLDHENIIEMTSDPAFETLRQSLPAEKQSVEQQKASVQTGVLTSAEAKSIAVAHANVEESKLRDYEIELENERGVTYYEISFESKGWEYEYEIEAYTGEILRRETEKDR